MYGRLGDIKKELEKYGFIQTHRTYLVNPERVKTFKKNKLIMPDGAIVPVVKDRKEDYRKLQNYLQGRMLNDVDGL
jgi:DNA-binding LytR/AlgR family response regulator